MWRDDAPRAARTACPVADEAVEPLRHLDAGEALLARSGRRRARRARATSRRCTGTAGPTRPRAASAPGRCRAREAALEPASSSSASSIVIDRDPSRPSAGRSSRFQSSAWRPVSSVDARSRIAGEHLAGGVRPSAGARRAPCLLVEQAGDAHHEELVEVGREDGAELDALEQRLRSSAGELEDALVELEPRQLAVEEARRRLRDARGMGASCQSDAGARVRCRDCRRAVLAGSRS